MTSDATAPEDPVVSVMVDDVETAYRQAQERGYEIVHPLTTEAWGVTRFFVQLPMATCSTSFSSTQAEGLGNRRRKDAGSCLGSGSSRGARTSLRPDLSVATGLGLDLCAKPLV